MKKRGQASLYIVFMLSAIFILIIVAVMAPLGVLLNSEFYQAGEDVLRLTASDISSIQDETARTQINKSIYNAIDQTQTNIEVNASLFQYGWVIILILSSVITFLVARQLVEFQGGGRLV